jgi:hypothetical protein
MPVLSNKLRTSPKVSTSRHYKNANELVATLIPIKQTTHSLHGRLTQTTPKPLSYFLD